MEKKLKSSTAKRGKKPSDVKDLPVKNAGSVKGGSGAPIEDARKYQTLSNASQ